MIKIPQVGGFFDIIKQIDLFGGVKVDF